MSGTWLRRVGICLFGACLFGAGCFVLMTQPGVTPVRTPLTVAADPARLRDDVRFLSTALYPRSYDDPANLDAAATFIATRFRQAGASVEFQDVRVQGMAYRNVIARFGPTHGAVIVVGAHYDACKIRDSDPDATPGADDNASGVAALLELARLLHRQPPPQPVELVAYTLEEPPFFRTGDMGSAWHARRLREQGRLVRMMLSLEMLGFYSDAQGSQRYPAPGMSSIYGDRGNFVALVGRFGDFSVMRRAKALMSGASALPVRSINAPPLLVGVDFSDHLSYWHAGFPALMVTDTAFYRNRAYHGDGDTWDRLDYRRMADVVQGVAAIVEHQP